MAQGAQRGQGRCLGKRLGVISTGCARETLFLKVPWAGSWQPKPSGGNAELEAIFNGGSRPIARKDEAFGGKRGSTDVPLWFSQH